MTNKKVVELDAEFIEYKAEEKASIDALEKKIDDGIRKLDVSVKAMKEESNAKIEELKQLIMDHGYCSITINTCGSCASNYQGSCKDSPCRVEGEDAYGWIYRVERYFEIQGLPQHEQLRAALLCMKGEALSWYRWSEGRTPFHSRDGFKRRLLIRFQQSQEGNLAAVRVMNPEGLNNAMELAVSIEDNQLYEGVMQSKGVAAIEKVEDAGLPQHEQLRAALCMEGKALSWKNRLEAVALFEKLACKWLGCRKCDGSHSSHFLYKGLALRAAVRVMNPEGLNNAMELAVSIEDNQLYEGVAAIVGQTTSKGVNFRRTESEIQDRKAKGLCFTCEEKYTPGHRCESRLASNIMASSLNGLSVGDPLPESLMDSPARSDSMFYLRDELPLQYSPMSEDLDECRYYESNACSPSPSQTDSQRQYNN
ncbi:hypothetical protein Tco_0071897 [Tanacetum coccineum]